MLLIDPKYNHQLIYKLNKEDLRWRKKPITRMKTEEAITETKGNIGSGVESLTAQTDMTARCLVEPFNIVSTKGPQMHGRENLSSNNKEK